MAEWRALKAKDRLTTLVEAAENHGPQVVMRDTEAVAIVMSPGDYRRLVEQANSRFGELLAQSPMGAEDAEPVGMSLGG